MIAALLDSCKQHGPDWVALLIVVLLLKRILEKWYVHLREDRDDMRRFTDRAVEAMERIASGCQSCHEDLRKTVSRSTGDSEDKIVRTFREMFEPLTAVLKEILAALGREEDKTLVALEGVRNAVLFNTTLLQGASPPPVGGTGSQVRDNGGAGR
jgi:hypothetical protein